MRVILSHPFSGALHWWFAAQSTAADDQTSKTPQHPYYRALYGDVERNIAVALLCGVVFDEVVLPAVDAPYPQFERVTDQQMRLPSLEVTADWEPVVEAQQLLATTEDALRQDEVVARLLMPLGEEAQRLELLYAAADVLAADAYTAPVLCAPGRRTLVLRLIDLDVAPVSRGLAEAIAAAGGLTEGIDAYTGIVGLKFSSRTTEELARMKWNDKIRRYASSMQGVLSRELPAGRPEFLEEIASAWEAADAAGQTGEAFAALSRVMGPAGLIPGIGTIATATGVAADAASEVMERRAQHFRWYEIGPEIHYYESMARLKDALVQHGADR